MLWSVLLRVKSFRDVLPKKHLFLNENSVLKQQLKHFYVHLTTYSLEIIKSQIFAVFVMFFSCVLIY